MLERKEHFELYSHSYLARNHRYWQKRGVPGPRPWPFFGTYLRQFFKPFPETEMQWYNEYGKIYGYALQKSFSHLLIPFLFV